MKIDFPTTVFNIDPEPQVDPSPISQLPTDPLLAAFQTAVFASDAYTLLPITLSQVCSRWRDLAINTPTLWRNIVAVNELEASTASVEKTLKRVQAFLTLSRECHLSIEITFLSWSIHQGESGDENPCVVNLPLFRQRISEISTAIGQHVHRIANFKLTVDEYETTAIVMRGLGSMSMPILKTWYVHNAYEEQAFSHPENEPEYEEEVHAHSLLLRPDTNADDDSSLYPKLRHVCIRSTPLHWRRFSPRNLVSLELGMLQTTSRPFSAILHKILSANAHSLERLCLHAALRGDEWAETCALPNLEWLELGFIDSSEPVAFLNAIEAPKLKRLAICDLMRLNYCPCFGLGDAFDPNIADLFKVVMRRLPLHNLWYLALTHIALCPPHQHPVQPSHVEVYVQALTFALKFFCELTALTDLALSGPDHATMDALNHILPRSMERHGTTQPRLPTPQLCNLSVADAPSLVLRHFINQRVENQRTFRPLDGLALSMPKEWFATVSRDCVKWSSLAHKILPHVSCAHVHETEADMLPL